MGWRVVNNVTGLPESKIFETEELANGLCRQMNIDAYRANMGGLYGVEEVKE